LVGHRSGGSPDAISEVGKLSRKVTKISSTDLIDLLLAADECTRKLLIFRALQTGAIKKSEAEEVVAQMMGLERVMGMERPAGPERPADPRLVILRARPQVA
jgi:hypothetical protein